MEGKRAEDNGGEGEPASPVKQGGALASKMFITRGDEGETISNTYFMEEMRPR